MTTVPAAIYIALRNRETEAAACLINHLATTDPDTADRIRHAIEHAEARLRAERGALEMRDWADLTNDRNKEWWA